MKHILYLHGFLSSPNSEKAQQTQAFLASSQWRDDVALIIPQLPNEPVAVSELLTATLAQYQDSLVGFIGSSLGGYLVTYCSEQSGLPAVAINPAAHPYELLKAYTGEHTHPYTGQQFVVNEHFNQSLRELDVVDPSHLPIWTLLQTGDETLDYREAERKYGQCKLTIEQGGDHAFQDYQRFLPQIFEFILTR